MTKSINPPTPTSFSQVYVAYCHVHSLPVSVDILTPQLDADATLYLEVEKLKRDEDWVPVMKSLRKDASLKNILFFSNEGIKRALKIRDTNRRG